MNHRITVAANAYHSAFIGASIYNDAASTTFEASYAAITAANAVYAVNANAHSDAYEAARAAAAAIFAANKN